LTAFAALNDQFAKTSFSPAERELIELTVSTENRCSYCVAGHSAFAAMQDVDEEIVRAAREGKPIPDRKLESLRRFTLALVRNRGMVTDSQVDRFLSAGYTQRQLLEVILGVCVKVMSNLANNAIGIPLDEAFAPYVWQAIPVRFQTIQTKAA
jgi:AhpD family alkylhydroperoxidase